MSALTTVEMVLDCFREGGGREARRRQSLVQRAKPERRESRGNKIPKQILIRKMGVRRNRSGRRASRKELTWTLVALRAATEPAKEEAMQAILIEVGGCKESWVCVREWLLCRGRERQKASQKNIECASVAKQRSFIGRPA